MHKRGQFEVLQLSFLFEVLIAVAVAGLLVYSAVSFDVFSKFKREYADADISLLMDQVVSSPGPIEVKYYLSDKYKVVIGPGSVEVNVEPSFLPSSKSYLLISKDSSGVLDVKRIVQ